MPVVIKLTFPAGRYHATPWGRHVNEGVPEWPPSPWRLLRALIAVWKRTCPSLSESVIRRILEPLAGPPRFRLPPHRVAHTRHYMPWEKKGPADRTLVFDTFVGVGRHDPLFVGWPDAELSADDLSGLSRLLGNLCSLGRAEGWVQAGLFADSVDLPLGLADASDPNPLPVLCPDPMTAFDNEHYPTLDPKKLAKGKVSPSDFLFDCPRWHLCLDTETVHRERWPTIPGARWVNYTRPWETAAVSTATKPTNRPTPTLARFLLDAPVLPPSTETLPLAEQARRSLLSKCKYLVRQREPDLADRDLWPRSPAFWGKDHAAQPRTGHEHAFFLPVDEDCDGRLDHLTVFAPMGFNELEYAALGRLRRLQWGDSEPLQVALIGIGGPSDFRAPILESARNWVSATPFLVTRYPKRRGTKRDRPEDYATPRDFACHVLRQELLRQSELPEIVSIDPLDHIGSHQLRPIQFRRFRNKPGDDGGRRPAAGFHIEFAAAVAGPLCLGHACHFGLGLFVASSSVAIRAAT